MAGQRSSSAWARWTSAQASMVCSSSPSSRRPIDRGRSSGRHRRPPRAVYVRSSASLRCPAAARSRWGLRSEASWTIFVLMARVLVPLPDRDFDPTEAAVPWHTLTAAGHQVVFATEHGAVAACDPLLIRGVIFGELGAKPDPKGFYAAMVASKELRKPIT